MGLIRKGYEKTKRVVHHIARNTSPAYRLVDNRYQAHKKRKERKKIAKREREYHRPRHEK